MSAVKVMEGAMVWMGREEKLDPLVYNHLFK